MNPILLAGPAVEPITLADMKGYLRLDADDEDDLVGALIMAGRITVERQARICLIEQTWRLTLRAWQRDRAVVLPLHPVIDIAAVRVSAGTDLPAVTIDPDLYRLDRSCDPGRLLIGSEVPDPARTFGGIEIDVTCGFGSSASAIPEPLILAIRRLVAHWFEHRGDAGSDEGLPRFVPGLPADALALIAPFSRPRLA